MFVGLFESKIVIDIWCKNTFDNSDDFLSKFASVFNARSSMIKHQPLTRVLQPSNISTQFSFFNHPLFKTFTNNRLLSTQPLSLYKLHFITATKSRFAGYSKFDNLLQTRKSEHFTRNMRFLANFAGEGG